MFDKEKEVPSLELCRELEAIGFPQEGGGWYWMKFSPERWQLIFLESRLVLKIDPEFTLKAPTSTQISEWLPNEIHYDGETYCYRQTLKRKSSFGYFDENYWVGYECKDLSNILHSAEGKTEADARAKMLFWLVKNQVSKIWWSYLKSKKI